MCDKCDIALAELLELLDKFVQKHVTHENISELSFDDNCDCCGA